MQTLLSNALKYSPPESPVHVALSIDEQWIVARVIDQGIGILSSELDSIFELMRRGSNIETRRGLGMGLYIAQSIANALGGSLSAESAGPNQGATFTLKIPLPVRQHA